MEEQFDAQAMMVRVGEVARQIRKSDAYPALVGGIAGGIAGALMAVIIASRWASRHAEPSAAKSGESRGGWSLREVAQFLTIMMPLAKQVQAWYKEQKK